MMLWSGRVATVTDADIQRRTDDRHGESQAEYDAMVASLISARDLVNPLLARLKGIENGNSVGDRLREDVRGARGLADQAITKLNSAVEHLDNVKELVTDVRNSKGR
jgi:hypothetical protein